MDRRYFLVRESSNEYDLKEIDPLIARAMDQFGVITGKFLHTVESTYWTFYFMNAQMTSKRANEVACDLTQEFLSGKRECRLSQMDVDH